ncbi:polysaccharide biosynthesis tyrosine autokinase [Yangia mangrovi]|uniref:non-specific protein-tyrosine kinase n=1 Tax=Alloyangia mangrovi TaxID=1779329 RepID=A0A2A3JZA3_9RHOB|nr:polysaccharide biosynthesis tyrosine autokinase [Alloyangia mangrovi]MCT4372282.1 polysaccharide biosynthesis tyrosine autokinase [Alloyangia mangrovi]
MKRIELSQRAASVSQDEDVIDLGALLGSLWRGKVIIILAFVAAVLLGGLYAYVLATPMYRATAVVMLNNREEQVVDLGSVMSGLGSDTTVINTEVEVLKSRVLLGKVVDKLELTTDPEFNASLKAPSTIDQLKGFLSSLVAPAGETESSGDARQREATIDALLTSMTIKNVSQSLVFQVTVETTDAAKSAKIADALVDLYILNQLEVKFEATEQATTWLTERVTDLQVALEEAEGKVKDFRASTPLVSPEALEGLEIQVKDTRERITSMETAQDAARARVAALEAAQTPQQQADATKDLQLQRMLPRVDEPAIAESFRTRFEQLSARAQAELTRNTSQLAALQNSLAELERQTEQQSQDLITLQQLSREAEASRLLYEYFLSRLKETSAQQGVQQADSRIISPAVEPVQASAPRKPLILAMSGILGLMLGAAFVLIREARNRAFRTAEQLEGTTGYATIGQLPMIKASRRKDAIAYLKERPSSAAAEAVRNLRTSVMLSNVDTPPKVIMTCSALPGEGKTTVAMSLTLNFASMGKKVLLIEGDIRRRVFGQYLTTEQTDGVVSVLTGAKTFDEVVTHDDLVGADVLLGDKGQSNAADIFSSVRFAELLKELRSRYDIIIVDTPPVLVVPDARVIAQHVDATVFVVKWDQTQREQVIGALREFESVGKPVSGLVLNQISPRGMKRYGYGNNYGPYSAYGAKYYLN